MKKDGGVMVSNLMNNMRKEKMREEVEKKPDEDEDLGESLILPQKISSDLFSKLKRENNIKKLSELLLNSKKLSKAKTHIKNGKFTDPDFPAGV